MSLGLVPFLPVRVFSLRTVLGAPRIKPAAASHLGEYLVIEVNARIADLSRATRHAGLRHVVCNPPHAAVPGIKCLPLDLSAEVESLAKLVEAEHAKLALLWCEFPSQPCSSYAANLALCV